MHAARAVPLLAAAICLSSIACATIVRGQHGDIVFHNAPDNLQAFDEQGTPLELKKQPDGTINGEIGFHTRQLTLTSGSTSTKVDLDTRVGLGYLVCDILLYIFPTAIDWGTSKWTNFEDVDYRVAITKPASAPANAPSPSHRLPAPPVEVADAKKSKSPSKPLIQPANSQSNLVQPAPVPAAVERRGPIIASGKLAVLDFKSYSDALKPEDVRYFTDVVRGATLRASPSLQVMTRENLLVLLQATGKDAANCEGECEVDTGRRIGADAVVSGEILKVGTHYKLSLKLHETHEGRLLSTAVASGKSIDELDDAAQNAALDLITPLR